MNELKSLYSGFWIDRPVGNNAFSFSERRQKRIYVPALIEGSIDSVKLGNHIVFSEIEDGQERNCIGLQNFVYFTWGNKPVFIFDNHNHAYTFWHYGFFNKILKKQVRLLHVDQHSDMRMPKQIPVKHTSIEECFQYANYSLNVGNFIVPAINQGWISDVIQVSSQGDFAKRPVAPFILDIDLDIFAPELDYIDNDVKLINLKLWMRESEIITIATSPFFIDTTRALIFLDKLFT